MASTSKEAAVLKTPLPNPSLKTTVQREVKMVEEPVREPGEGEVLVHVKVTGICGSDVHFWKSGCIGDLTVKDDIILGHESAGVVVRCGPGVSKFKPGDRVAIEPGESCLSCYLCTAGRYNLCENVHFASAPPFDGTLRRYKVHGAQWLHKLPDNLTLQEGALLEPLSVALQGVKTARIVLGTPALVTGAGPIGMATLLAARASGAHPIVVSDLEQSRLDFAQKLVPGISTYKVDRNLSNEQNAAKIREIFYSLGPNSSPDDSHDEKAYRLPRTVLECTGVESSICTGALVVRRGGALTVIGVGRPVINNVPFMHLSFAEIDLRFINRYTDTWPTGIACLQGKLLDMNPLVTHTFPLEKADEGIAFSANFANGSIKVHIVDDNETIFF